ncbi:MAG: hypothetical protein GYB68_07470 [Chloroflexi bacterium]|nr:hypothetical protein [Chloroflexota bacterium]
MIQLLQFHVTSATYQRVALTLAQQIAPDDLSSYQQQLATNLLKVTHEEAFCEWIQLEQIDVVRDLLRAGMTPDARDGSGKTALNIAVGLKNIELARLLLDHGADPNAQGRYIGAPIRQVRDRLDLLNLLLSYGADPNLLDHHRSPPLNAAVDADHLETVKRLVEAGAAINPFPAGRTPLMRAIRFNHREIALWLLDQGADPNVMNENGETALMIAVEKQPHLVPLLLARQADPDRQGHKGETALMMAVEKGNPDSVRALLAAGAKLDIKNDAGDTALDMAAYRPETLILVEEAAEVSLKPAVVEIEPRPVYPPLLQAVAMNEIEAVHRLLSDGVDVNAVVSYRGDSPLILAATHDHPEIAALLLEHGADAKKQNNWEETAWSYVFNESPQIQQLLEDADAGVDMDNLNSWAARTMRRDAFREAMGAGKLREVRDKLTSGEVNPDTYVSGGTTALTWAIVRGDHILVDLLLRAGALPDASNRNGTTPLRIAVARESMGAVRDLLEAGADPHLLNRDGLSAIEIARNLGLQRILALIEGGKSNN